MADIMSYSEVLAFFASAGHPTEETQIVMEYFKARVNDELLKVATASVQEYSFFIEGEKFWRLGVADLAYLVQEYETKGWEVTLEVKTEVSPAYRRGLYITMKAII